MLTIFNTFWGAPSNVLLVFIAGMWSHLWYNNSKGSKTGLPILSSCKCSSTLLGFQSHVIEGSKSIYLSRFSWSAKQSAFSAQSVIVGNQEEPASARKLFLTWDHDICGRCCLLWHLRLPVSDTGSHPQCPFQESLQTPSFLLAHYGKSGQWRASQSLVHYKSMAAVSSHIWITPGALWRYCGQL